MAQWQFGESPYAILGLEWEVEDRTKEPTKEEIKKAYRRQAKEKHPDKNPDNPNAKDEFDLLKRALDFLLDENKRNVWLKEARSKAFQFQKRKVQNEAKRKMMEDLERRENAFAQQIKRQKTQQENAKEKLQQERERLQQQMQQQKEQREQERRQQVRDGVQQQLKRSFKVYWDRRSGEYDGQELRQVFHDCGDIEDVIITTKKKKKGSALVIMKKEESLNKVMEKGHFGDIQNPLLITFGAKDKLQQTSQHPQQNFSYPSFSFRNLSQQSKSQTEQNIQGSPLFPVGGQEQQQPLFPIGLNQSQQAHQWNSQAQGQRLHSFGVNELLEQQNRYSNRMPDSPVEGSGLESRRTRKRPDS
eukprot:TRINITY_DN1314_c0_g1_i2.p1 TRINITY_DN1314_c0_g1~~TRINITY_DN1314_c0_g1_i2.p1  ORF type:complete len:359 (+),score=58.82 TRINITY_DN1314_c0_g1_i2:197-1273(+)